MQVETMRFRPKGENIARKFVVESSLDPLDHSAVILRVRPATAAELLEPEVLRMRELMQTQMRKGIQEIEELNGDLRQRELDEARKTVTRRWVAKTP